MLFSALLPVSASAVVVVIVGYVLIARLVLRRSAGESVIGGLAAAYVNSNNIGIPLSIYLLGSAAYPAVIILMQMLVLPPIAMGVLEAATSGHTTFWGPVRRALTNPIIVGSALGAVVSISGWKMPPIVLDPLQLIANAAVPVVLISYGISLHGRRVLAASGYRTDIILASVLKIIVLPVIAWVFARFVFGLSGHEVLVVVVLAALPTAQNVFNYSQRFGIGETIARDTVFITTVGCIPVLLLASVLLG